MTTMGNVVRDFSPGDYKQIDRVLHGLPDAESLSSATLVLKLNSTDPDSQAILTLSITTANDGAGQIVQTGIGTGTNRSARFNFVLQAAQTNLLRPGQVYVYIIRVLSTANVQYTPEYGQIVADGA